MGKSGTKVSWVQLTWAEWSDVVDLSSDVPQVEASSGARVVLSLVQLT